MDIAFSVDSILAAIALSEQIWVLLMGGVLGILAMHMVAGVFLKLIEAVPEFETTAFVLIALIGSKMFAGTLHQIVGMFAGTLHQIVGMFGVQMQEIHINHWLFFVILIGTFLGTFVVHSFNKNKEKDGQAKVS